MSFYTLAIYFWSAVATLGLATPFVVLATEALTKVFDCWLSSLRDDQPAISSQHGPLSVP